MIRGVGVDLCRISRIERLLQDEHFLKRVFHEEERDYAIAFVIVEVSSHDRSL